MSSNEMQNFCIDIEELFGFKIDEENYQKKVNTRSDKNLLRGSAESSLLRKDFLRSHKALFDQCDALILRGFVESSLISNYFLRSHKALTDRHNALFPSFPNKTSVKTSDKILEIMPPNFKNHVPEIVELISDYCKDYLFIYTKVRSFNIVNHYDIYGRLYMRSITEIIE
jgi:hypothetical protein